jgi:thiol-disulfide isomerase/thioredoxin
MKFWMWFAASLLVLLGLWLLQPRAVVVEVLPSAELRQVDGRVVNLADFIGKPIVLNAWATWCGPCRREMPMLVEAARANPGVHFVF